MRSLRAAITKFAHSLLEARRSRPPKEDTVAAYREKFKDAPLGNWSTPSRYETGPEPSVSWHFYENGQGKFVEYSGAGEYTEFFEWKSVSERCFSFRTTEIVDETGYFSEEELEEHIVEDGWVTISYDFKRINRLGSSIVMYQVPEGERLKFWTHDDYLAYDGPSSSTLER